MAIQQKRFSLRSLVNMTGRSAWKSPFAELSLSLTDHDELQVLVQTILDANTNRYVHFDSVDPSAWKKLIRGKDGLQVYSNRRDQRHWPHTVQLADDCELQTLLCVGSSPGSLNDMMHGVLQCVNGTRHASVNDVGATAELARIKAPSLLEPFASVAVKWMELDVYRRSMGRVQNRDYVYIEASGIKNLPSGEPLGYHIMHSVGIPEALKLPGRVRSELSICSFFRQDLQTVAIHSLAIVEPMSDRVRQFVVPCFIKTLQLTFKPAPPSSMGKVKKFAKTLGQRHSEQDTPRLSGLDHHCVTCSKRVGRMVKLARRQNACAICCGSICSACKIEKKQKVSSGGAKVMIKKVAFCLACLTDVVTSEGSQYSFEEDSDGESHLSAHHWAWSTKRPSWSIINPPVEFAFTR